MLIESIIRRPKGTKVELGSATYHFAPRGDDDRHVDDVDDQAHAATLLAIKEGFRSADGSIVAATIAGLDFDGPFFIVRGPQDLQAFAQWADSVPAMREEPGEFVLLIDKIAVGEADLGGFAPAEVRKLTFSPPSIPPATATAGGTAASEPSPRTPSTNSIIPDQSQAGVDAGADHGDAEASGNGGGGAAGGTAADTAADEDGDDEQPELAGGGLDREALAKKYDETFGHRPNGKWKADRIKQALDEHQG